jgi:hypothetical protein
MPFTHNLAENTVHVLLKIVLPDPNSSPAQFSERSDCLPIALFVSLYFRFPKLSVSRGDGATARTPMPNATIQEDGDSLLEENNVWFAGKAGIVSDDPTTNSGSG